MEPVKPRNSKEAIAAEKLLGQQRREQLKTTSLMSVVDGFYDDRANFDQLCKLLKRGEVRRERKRLTPRLSLRLIDYAVSVYSANGAIVVLQSKTCPTAKKVRSIHSIYRAGINAYGRSFYDIFRRHSAFVFRKHNREITVTLGQLLFVRDLIRYGILNWIQQNIFAIKAAMDGAGPSTPQAQAHGHKFAFKIEMC